MQIIRGNAHVPPDFGKSAVGIGIFDGVHRGHRVLLSQVVSLAQTERLTAVAYTFDPHPARVLNPALAPTLIEPLELRIDRLSAAGLGAVVVEPFNREFAATSAEAYVREILVGRLGAKHVVVGSDFTFGKGRSGNIALLERLGAELGFKVHAVDLLQVEGIAVSSTKVREFVRSGAVRGATLLLGRPYVLTGPVVRGAGRGEGLGFPTANIAAKNELVPGIGIYAARATGPFGTRPAAVSVGTNPTFGGGGLSVEAYLLDYNDGPFYGAMLQLEFIDKLRDEKRFDDISALKGQIALDVAMTRTMVASVEP